MCTFIDSRPEYYTLLRSVLWHNRLENPQLEQLRWLFSPKHDRNPGWGRTDHGHHVKLGIRDEDTMFRL